jgi:MFS family permease
VLANLLSLAAVCPFVGAISDLIGRRYVALMGAGLIVIGMIVCSTAHNMNIFIGTLPFQHPSFFFAKIFKVVWLSLELVQESTN